MPDIKKRDYIAHEIGHLFYLAKVDAMYKAKGEKMYNTTVEPMSSVFAVFAMSEKNDWYANYNIALENHKDWKQILDNLAAVQAGSL